MRSRNCLSFGRTCVLLRFLVGFVLLDLYGFLCNVFYTIVGHFVLFFWPLCCRSFFYLRFMITPLVSSTTSDGTFLIRTQLSEVRKFTLVIRNKCECLLLKYMYCSGSLMDNVNFIHNY